MCDYSLHGIENRLAEEGEILVVTPPEASMSDGPAYSGYPQDAFAFGIDLMRAQHEFEGRQ